MGIVSQYGRYLFGEFAFTIYYISIGSIFYFDTSVTAKGKFGTFRVSSPAALFAEKKDGKLILTVTDALMKKVLDSLTVYTSVPVRGEGASKQSKNIYEIKIPLPAGAHCGQPATVTLELL